MIKMNITAIIKKVVLNYKKRSRLYVKTKRKLTIIEKVK